MILPLYDYLCMKCGHNEERLEFGEEIDKEHMCPECKNVMDRTVSLCSFKLVYNNKTDSCAWGNEGYASSHYWDAYKKARAEGQDVKPYGED